MTDTVVEWIARKYHAFGLIPFWGGGFKHWSFEIVPFPLNILMWRNISGDLGVGLCPEGSAKAKAEALQQVMSIHI